MNKLLLALLILGTGAAVSARLARLTNQGRAAATDAGAECRRLVSQAEQLAASATELRSEVQSKKTRLNLESASAPETRGASATTALANASRSSKRPTPAELRRRFGIAWDNSPDYVLVSKEALKKMSVNGFGTNGTFTPNACAVLGLTPTERDTIQAALKRAEAEHADWVKTAVQRVEPAGDIVADYRLPANPALATRIQTEGMALLLGTVGAERAEFVQGCARTWRFTHGFLGEKGVRLAVHRNPEGQNPPLWFQYEVEGGGSTTGIVRTGEFYDLWRPVFPGGWPDMAQREGFALPQDFK